DEAHVFAAAFLMPGPQFLATAPQRISLATVVEAKQLRKTIISQWRALILWRV
ncbi:MAG: hypothetical protein AVDCRST_MAG96-1977, partial [uncultured Segetibacter sp.]